MIYPIIIPQTRTVECIVQNNKTYCEKGPNPTSQEAGYMILIVIGGLVACATPVVLVMITDNPGWFLLYLIIPLIVALFLIF